MYLQDKSIVMPGDDTQLSLTLNAPVVIEKEQRFTLREGGMTVGMGVVTEVVE